MIAFDTIDLVTRIKEHLSTLRWSSLVKKSEWPKDVGYGALHLWLEDLKLPSSPLRAGVTIREYRLKHAALESADLRRYSNQIVEDGFLENLAYFWETKFQTDIWNSMENRVIERELELSWPIGSVVCNAFYLPRRSLFGKLVYPFSASFKGGRVLNKKYYRCPARVIEFHPDTVHFQFPDLENWFGSLKYYNIHDLENGDRKFYRIVMTVAAKPMMTHLGRAVTVLPNGLRGWLYSVVWKLLRIKP